MFWCSNWFIEELYTCLENILLLKQSYFYFFWELHFYYYFLVYCCSSKIVSMFPPPHALTSAILTSHLNPNPLWLCPCVIYVCSLTSHFYFFRKNFLSVFWSTPHVTQVKFSSFSYTLAQMLEKMFIHIFSSFIKNTGKLGRWQLTTLKA